jgi:hypothetical protein
MYIAEYSWDNLHWILVLKKKMQLHSSPTKKKKNAIARKVTFYNNSPLNIMKTNIAMMWMSNIQGEDSPHTAQIFQENAWYSSFLDKLW